MEHRPGESGNHLCRIIQCLSFTSLRTLLAMAGRQQDGEEAMVAGTLGGELLVVGILQIKESVGSPFGRYFPPC